MTVLILTILLLVLLVCLLAPIRVRLTTGPEGGMVRVRYLWLRREYQVAPFAERLGEFGLHRLESLRDFAMPRGGTDRATKADAQRREADWTAMWINRGVWRRVVHVLLRMIGRILRSWTVEEARLAVAFGLGDPAYTGMATGYAHAFWPTIGTFLPRWKVSFHPDFDSAVFALDADIRLRLIPIAPLWRILQALGSLPWSGLWKMRKAWSS
jgi:hypothetical protein